MIPFRSSLFSLLCALCVLCGSPLTTRAADTWYKLKDVSFPERRSITLQNTTDSAITGYAVSINLDQLNVSDDAAGTAVIVDPNAPPQIGGEAAGTLVPHQVFDSIITFSASLKPNEKKTWYLYTTRQIIHGVSFPPQTSADIRPGHAYRSFENNKMAFRIEIGPDASSTGMSIDLFGKTKAGQQMGAILADKIYKSDTNQMQDWGTDILKVASSPGLGGVYVFDGDKSGRPDCKTTTFDILEQGPVLTRVRARGPVDVNGHKVDVSRTMTVIADDRGVDDVVQITGDPKTLETLKIGLGLRNLPDQTWSEDPKAGYVFIDGAPNQRGADHLGIGLAFVPAKYFKTESIPDPVDTGHIVLLTPDSKDGALTIHDHLGAYWNADGEVTTKDAFQKTLIDWSRILQSPPKLTVGQAERAK